MFTFKFFPYTIYLDDAELSMSEVDIKAEGEIEEGESISLHTNMKDDNQHQVIQIEGTDETDTNMVVASMLPMNELNMEDQATYVALAQLTQAAIENAPVDDQGNVILMSYEDIQKSMQEIHAAQQHEHKQQPVDISVHDIQIAQQQETESLQVVLDAASHSSHHREEDEYDQHAHVNALVMHDHNVDLPNIEHVQVNLNVSN